MVRTTRGPDSGPENTRWFAGILLVIVVVLIGVLVLDNTGSHSTVSTATTKTNSHPTTTVTTVPQSTTSTTVVPPAQVKVQVLNGVLTGSLAAQWTTKLKTTSGYQTETPDDATSKVAASVIYVMTPGYIPEAQALAATVGLAASAVDTTVPAPSTAPIKATERTAANLVLIIGPDLASSA